jgi:hypothetical protein
MSARVKRDSFFGESYDLSWCRIRREIPSDRILIRGVVGCLDLCVASSVVGARPLVTAVPNAGDV